MVLLQSYYPRALQTDDPKKRYVPSFEVGEHRTAARGQVIQVVISKKLTSSEADGARTRNHRIDSPVL